MEVSAGPADLHKMATHSDLKIPHGGRHQSLGQVTLLGITFFNNKLTPIITTSTVLQTLTHFLSQDIDTVTYISVGRYRNKI